MKIERLSAKAEDYLETILRLSETTRGARTGDIAAALDVPTVGVFPAHRSATPLRWRPLNSEGRHLAFSPPEDSDHPDDMSQLDPKAMAAAIARWAPPFWRAEG